MGIALKLKCLVRRTTPLSTWHVLCASLNISSKKTLNANQEQT